jgi:hypothetical protein
MMCGIRQRFVNFHAVTHASGVFFSVLFGGRIRRGESPGSDLNSPLDNPGIVPLCFSVAPGAHFCLCRTGTYGALQAISRILCHI